MKVKKHETVILDAEMAVTRTESGMDYVQVLPDHPSMGQVVPFSGWGRGQLMQNGTFDFIRKKRVRKKPEYKGRHISLSFGEDGNDRCTFILPSAQRSEFRVLLMEEVMRVCAHLERQGW